MTPHITALEDAINVFSSAAKHNTAMGRTIFAHEQQQRADALRDVLEYFKSVKENE